MKTACSAALLTGLQMASTTVALLCLRVFLRNSNILLGLGKHLNKVHQPLLPHAQEADPVAVELQASMLSSVSASNNVAIQATEVYF